MRTSTKLLGFWTEGSQSSRITTLIVPLLCVFKQKDEWQKFVMRLGFLHYVLSVWDKVHHDFSS
jgi:hypothetical protein